MSDSTTVNVRLTLSIHTVAKMEAAKRGQSIGDFVGDAVQAYLGKKSPAAHSGLTRQISELPESGRRIIERCITLVDLAPSVYLRLFDRHISKQIANYKRAYSAARSATKELGR